MDEPTLSRFSELTAVRAATRLIRRRFGLALELSETEDGAGDDDAVAAIVRRGDERAGALVARDPRDRCQPPRPGSPGRAHLDDLLAIAAEAVSAQLTTEAPTRTVGRGTRHDYGSIIGDSAPMRALYLLLDKVIDADSTVLVQGENGTGKELVARAIHGNSRRREGPFIAQNCGALPDALLESELFGHVRGAFSGASGDKLGLFAVADGGTFFLDEIGEMSPALQVKLLRVLQEGVFTRLGETGPQRVDVRIIAATHHRLRELVERGAFREDLYYRIHVLDVSMPPLRERLADIEPLAEHFLARQARARNAPRKRLAADALARITRYHWPGNVRELENEIERLVVLAGERELIAAELLSARICQGEPPDASEASCLPDAMKNLERNLIYEVLKRHDWNKTRAARELRISRRNLIRKVQKYRLDR